MPGFDFSQAASGFTKVGEVILAATAASIDIQNIPQSFRNLHVTYVLRGDATNTQAPGVMRLNNDGAANYDYQRFENSSGSSLITSEALASTGMLLGYAVDASGAANKAMYGSAFIPFYSGTTFEKDVLVHAYGRFATASGNATMDITGNTWRSAAAINRITILPASGNFVAGSGACVYAY